MVVHVYNPSSREGEAGRSRVEASLDYIMRHCLKLEKKKILPFSREGKTVDIV
jgi:hypothetical protein